MKFNQVVLCCRLTKDPEIKTLPNGTVICAMRVAWDQHQGGEKHAGFAEVTCFQKQAEAAAKFLHKGSAILVGGRLDYQEWNDKQSGQKRSALKIAAHDIQFLDRKGDGKADGSTPADAAGTTERPAGW